MYLQIYKFCHRCVSVNTFKSDSWRYQAEPMSFQNQCVPCQAPTERSIDCVSRLQLAWRQRHCSVWPWESILELCITCAHMYRRRIISFHWFSHDFISSLLDVILAFWFKCTSTITIRIQLTQIYLVLEKKCGLGCNNFVWAKMKCLNMSMIVGALVTWAIYTQGQLLLWSSLIITGVVPGYTWPRWLRLQLS